MIWRARAQHTNGAELLNLPKQPHLSIIIPAHNEEHRLPHSLPKIDAFLKAQPYEAEVIIVENGSHDRTVEVARAYADDHPYVRVLEVETRGKGLAVKAGMLAAHGAYRFICDVDLSMPIEDVTAFLPPYADGYDISIATREGPAARRVGEPEHRHIMGRINNWIIQLVAVRGFEDTQCGFKMFTKAAAEDLFSVQQMSGIGFDVEILFIAKRRGYRVREVPITWYFDPDSRIRLIGDTLNILREIWQIRRNWSKGAYGKAAIKDSQPEP
ncbi:MAG: glycosyltransferase family 2 protein [Chloroflexi bacterium]|nr:glycosyltransferase family 2 protein [Chloroflexota bacterium]